MWYSSWRWKQCGIIFQVFDRSTYGIKIHGSLLDDTVFFESNVVKISSSNYPWTTPNLRRCTFNKVPKTDKSYKETHILSTTGNLKLNVANDDSICIENVDDSKNKYLLKNGKLQSPIFLFTQFHRKPKIWTWGRRLYISWVSMRYIPNIKFLYGS